MDFNNSAHKAIDRLKMAEAFINTAEDANVSELTDVLEQINHLQRRTIEIIQARLHRSR